MLSQNHARIIQQVAHELTLADQPFSGTDQNRYQRIRSDLLKISGSTKVITQWGETLPSPEVSLELLERLSMLSPRIGKLCLRVTVDDMFGCWALPLPAEKDSKGRARYPTLNDSSVGAKGMLAHRYAWRMLLDPDIPTNEHLDHLCRIHACCNITHLEPVSQGLNTQRGYHARHILSGQDPLFHPEA